MDNRSRWWKRAATVVAAYLFALQTTIAAFALGLEPGQAQLDAFGNVICSHDGAAELPNGDAPVRHMPACCVLGCGMTTPLLDVPPVMAVAFAGDFSRAVVYRPLPTGHIVSVPDWSPSNPRAPPAA